MRKCIQVGASYSTNVKMLHLGDQAPITIIYSLPTSSEAKNFVLSKFDPMIERSPGLLNMVQRIALRDRILYNSVVKRIGESYYFFRGSWVSHTAQSIDADILVVDELDFQKPEVRLMWEERTAGSASLDIIYWIGYPSIPNFGIEELYQNSDQRKWYIECIESGQVILIKDYTGIKCLPIADAFDNVKGQIVCYNNIQDYKIPQLKTQVLSLNESLDPIWTDLNKLIRTKQKSKIVASSLSSSWIETTEDHKVFAGKNRYVKQFKSFNTCKQKDAKIGSYFPTVSKFNIPVKKKPFIDPWFLGFWLAEGSFHKDKRSKNEVKGLIVCQAQKNKTIVDKVDSLQLTNSRYERTIDFNGYQTDMIYWYILNTKLAEKFLACGHNSKEKLLPFDFIEYSDTDIWAIIAGIIDGDGSGNRRGITIRLQSKSLLFQLHFWLRLKGIKSGISKLKHGADLYCLCISKRCLQYMPMLIKDIKPYSLYKESFVNKTEKLKSKRLISDTDYVYDISTANEKFLINGTLVHNCGHCFKRQVLEFPDSINIDTEKYICKYCKKELTDDMRRKGLWKVTNPKNKAIHGYWINKLMAPWVPASNIVERFKKDPPKKFHNYTLGLPYVAKDTDITDKVVQEAMMEEDEYALVKKSEDARIFVGIDQGDIFHMLVAMATTNMLVVIAAEQLRSEEEVLKRLNFYHPDMVVMDMFPNRHTAKNLCKAYGSNKLFMAKERNWTETSKARNYWNLNRATSEVGVERTESLDAMIEYIMKGAIRFRRTVPRLLIQDKQDPGVIQQLKNLVPDIQERHGRMRRVFKAVGPEHYGHALNFLVVACHIFFPGWMNRQALVHSSYLEDLKRKKTKPWYVTDFENRVQGLNPHDSIIIKPGGEIIEPSNDFQPRFC